MMFPRIFTALIFFLASVFSIESNAQLSMAEFIGSAHEEYEVKTFEDQISYLDKKPYRISPLREVEFRTRNRELLRTHQEYGLRFSPANPWEMRANTRYYENLKGSISFEKEFALKEALIDRYYTIIEYLYYVELKALNTTRQEMMEQQLAILEQQSGSRYFDADEFAEIKVDQLDLVVDWQEYDYEATNQLQRIVRLYPKAYQRSITWDPAAIITVERLKMNVDSMVNSSIRSILVSYQQQQIKLAQSHYDLEKTNINLGFAQASYDFRRYHQDRTPVVISFGLTIPITNPNKGDMARRKLQVIDAEYDLKEAASESETDVLIHQERVYSLLTRYFGLKVRIKELEESNFAQTLSTIQGGDPLMYVQFNERIRKLDTLLLKIKRNLLTAYIDYLAITDRLQQQPLVNYFSNTLDQVDIR